MKTKYIIQDWAGNIMFGSKEFETSDDAHEFLYEKFPDDDDLQEYYVIEFSQKN